MLFYISCYILLWCCKFGASVAGNGAPVELFCSVFFLSGWSCFVAEMRASNVELTDMVEITLSMLVFYIPNFPWYFSKDWIF